MSKALIGFSTRKYNPLSALIRKMTKAKCSHAWLMYHDPFFSRPMVMEATEWGVRIIDAEIFYKRNQIVEVYIPSVDLTPAIQLSGDVIGELYDFAGLIGMSLVMAAMAWFKKKIRNPLQNPHGLFCSELVALKMEQSFYPKFNKDPSTLSPEFIRKFLSLEKDAKCLERGLTPAQCISMSTKKNATT